MIKFLTKLHAFTVKSIKLWVSNEEKSIESMKTEITNKRDVIRKANRLIGQ